MTSRHLTTAMNALHQAASPAAPIMASAGSGVGMPRAEFDANLVAARKAGADAERTRIGAILGHEAAAGRGKLATHLAFKTSMSVEDAGEMLGASATEGAATGAVDAGFSWDEIVAGFNSTLPSAATAHQGQSAAGREPAPATAGADAAFSWSDVVAEVNASNGFHQGSTR